MKTLIVYSSKHGTTERCVKRLAKELTKETEVVNLGSNSSLDISKYNNIIIGSPIYAGSIMKEVKEFCSKNLNNLKNKRIGLFITCMKQEGSIEQLEAAYPSEILDVSVANAVFGGGMIYSDMGFVEKTLIKMIVKSVAKKNPNEPAISTKEDSEVIYEAAIDEFVKRYELSE